ncbi:unnamed protein product, partial [Nezara viridula]
MPAAHASSSASIQKRASNPDLISCPVLAKLVESIRRIVQYWVLSRGREAAERGILMAGSVALKASDRKVAERVHTFVSYWGRGRDQLKVEKFALTARAVSAKLQSIVSPQVLYSGGLLELSIRCYLCLIEVMHLR